MPSALEIRSQIVNYLVAQMDYEQFDEWIARNTWNIHHSSDVEARELVFAVESKLAEFSSGLVAENVLKSNLVPFVSQYKISVGAPVPSNDSDINWKWVHPCQIVNSSAAAADIKFSVVPA